MPADANRLKNLFAAAIELSDPDGRQAFLDRESAGDPDLRARIDELLRAHADPASALERPFGNLADPGTRSFAPSEDATADHPGRDEHVGAVLGGKYKLIEAIGEGGMGSVYMAQQTEPVKRAVAVKVIKAGMDSKAVLARFEAERQALAMMDHPNIAKVLDAGTTESGRPYFVMELVKGVPITQYCDERKLTPRQRLELFVPVCNAIQHAHQKGVIHRDIKPSNVLVALYDDRPVPKVIDFGVAKATGLTLTDRTLMTGFGAVVGTPEYMSPEQASLNNLDIDTRSDVYSLGVVLYELLTGTTPVDRKSLGKAALLEVLRIVREVEAPRPSHKLSTSDALPSVAANRATEPAKLSKLMKGELDWVLLKALEKDRTRRYESANGLARDIQRYLADEIVEARPPSTGYRVKKFVRRHKGQVIAVGLVLATLLAGIVGTTLGLLEARRQADIARDETASKEKALTAETEQRTLAQAARDRASTSDAFARETIERVIDGNVVTRFPTERSDKPRTMEDIQAENDKQWQIYRAFYEREIGDHPSGERHEAAALRLGYTLTMLRQKPEAIRTLDGLIGTLAARLESDPTRNADLRALADAIKMRTRIPEIARVTWSGSPEEQMVAYRAARAEGYEYQLRAKELLVKIAPKQSWPFAYRKLMIEHDRDMFKHLYSRLQEARQAEEYKLPLPKTEIPADLVQQIGAQREDYYRLLREALAQYPDAPEDAAWLRQEVNAAAMEKVFALDASPSTVRDEFLVALFKIEMKREMATPSPIRPIRPWVGQKEQQLTLDEQRAVLSAWETACKEVPGYPKAGTGAANRKTALFVAEMFERRSVSEHNRTPDHVRRGVELIADQRKLLADVRSRPAAFPTDDGVPLYVVLRDSMIRPLTSSEHLRDAIDLLAEWKREQAEAGQPPATAEVLKRLKLQGSFFGDRFLIANAVGVSKEQATALAEETLLEYENLFRDRAVSKVDAAVNEYFVAAEWLSRAHFEAKRYEDTIRVVRSAYNRAGEFPPQPKDANVSSSFRAMSDRIRKLVGLSLHNLKRYPEAVVEYEACIAVLAKEPEVPRLAEGNTGDGVAADLLHLRLLRAKAILSNGQLDEASAASLNAIRTYWEVCGRLQSARGNFNDAIKYNAAVYILREAPLIVGELRAAKATAELDRWAAELRPTLDQAAAELFKRQGPKVVPTYTAALCEQFRQLIWERQDRGDTKQAIAFTDAILALKPEAQYAARIQMSRARLVALTGDHAAASKEAKVLLDAPNAQMTMIWFVADAALCYAECANACKGDELLREKYAAEAVRLLRVCWTVDPKEVPNLSRFTEFRPHTGRADFQALRKEIDAKFPPPPREVAPMPRVAK